MERVSPPPPLPSVKMNMDLTTDDKITDGDATCDVHGPVSIGSTGPEQTVIEDRPEQTVIEDRPEQTVIEDRPEQTVIEDLEDDSDLLETTTPSQIENKKTVTKTTEPLKDSTPEDTPQSETKIPTKDEMMGKSSETFINSSRQKDCEKSVMEGAVDSNDSSSKVTEVRTCGCYSITKVLEERHLVEKFVFVLSVLTLILLTSCLLSLHWLLPYYYTVTYPILLAVRLVMYCKLKYQYFLIDLCYFGNLLLYIYIWAAPWLGQYFCICFGLANGPLAWAILIFRNSLVFHHTDKMISAYIHFLPLLITYCIRWFPVLTSRYWYRPFLYTHTQDLPFIFIWLVALPMVFFIIHNMIYLFFLLVVMKPGPQYLNTYRYLIEGKRFSKVFGVCGQRYKKFLFYMGFYFYTLCTLLFGVLLYKYFVLHTIFIGCCLLTCLWNASSFYLDVFAYKGYKAEVV